MKKIKGYHREEKWRKRRYGMRVSGRSVFILTKQAGTARGKSKRKRQKRWTRRD